MSGDVDRPSLAVVGSGAAGLFAAIWAARTAREAGLALRVVALDGARTLGAKILVAGGGRCNVTHDQVDERDFAGSTPAAIRRVLSRFGVAETVAFFAQQGVALKREPTGKLFPTDDRARSVLDALLRAARSVEVELTHPWRVERIDRVDSANSGTPEDFRIHAPRFRLHADDGRTLEAARVVLATGGKSLPKSGSDGTGYGLARSLGHSLTDRIAPALVPLCLSADHPLRGLAGVATPAAVEVRSGSGRRLAVVEGDVLCTHFGLSGPAILDISRHLGEARGHDPGATLVINWLPGESEASLGSAIAASRDDRPAQARLLPRTAGQLLRHHLPERLADALLAMAEVEPQRPLTQVRREERHRLVRCACALEVPVVGDRGWTYAEVTAGGVPLREVDPATMESRVCPGLHLCGEILDVDGRIGGYNFQWAWASGFVAGCAAGCAPGKRGLGPT